MILVLVPEHTSPINFIVVFCETTSVLLDLYAWLCRVRCILLNRVQVSIVQRYNKYPRLKNDEALFYFIADVCKKDRNELFPIMFDMW